MTIYSLINKYQINNEPAIYNDIKIALKALYSRKTNNDTLYRIDMLGKYSQATNKPYERKIKWKPYF